MIQWIEWISVIPAISSGLLLLLIPGGIVLGIFQVQKWIVLSAAPLLSIVWFRLCGELYRLLHINYNIVTVGIGTIVLVALATFFRVLKIGSSGQTFFPRWQLKNLPRVSLYGVVFIFFGCLTIFQYMLLANSPYDVFTWNDQISHQEYVLNISQDQQVTPFDLGGYPIGAHLVAVLNAEIAQISITTSLIVVEAIGAIMLVVGICNISNYFWNMKILGTIIGGGIATAVYAGVRFYPTVTPLFAFYFGICLLPSALVTLFRALNHDLILKSSWKQILTIFAVSFSMFIVHSSLLPFVLLFGVLYFSQLNFRRHLWLSLILVLFSVFVWGYSSLRLNIIDFASSGSVWMAKSWPFAFVYETETLNWIFLLLVLGGGIICFFDFFGIYVFSLSIFLIFLITINFPVFANNPDFSILQFLFKIFSGLFYGQPVRVQAVYLIVAALLSIICLRYAFSFVMRTCLSIHKSAWFYRTILLFPIALLGMVLVSNYLETFSQGIYSSNRIVLSRNNDFKFSEKDLAVIVQERTFLYRAKEIVDRDALVQIEANRGGLLLRYLQGVNIYPSREFALLYDPDSQGLAQTCELISSSDQQVYFLNLFEDPYQYWGSYGPNFNYHHKYPTRVILSDGTNLLYQLDCRGIHA
jgi:hypothetical protein